MLENHMVQPFHDDGDDPYDRKPERDDPTDDERRESLDLYTIPISVVNELQESLAALGKILKEMEKVKILYNSEDLKRIIGKHHSYSNEPIKVGYTTQDVIGVEIVGGEVIVTLGKEEDEE